MSRHNFVGFCVLLSVAIVTGEHFIVNNEQTFWNETPCTPGAPNLVYADETGWRVDKSNLQITHDDEVWIGYIEATFVFKYFGCAEVPQMVAKKIILVNTAVECYLACRAFFGIQKSDVILETACTDTCGNPQLVCGKQQTNYFSLYIRNSNDISIFGDSLKKNDNCLIFKPPQTYLWKECTKPCRILCSNRTNGRRTAIGQARYNEHWYQANIDCFDHGLYPATLESIRNANFSNTDVQDHWTSYVRTSLVTKANIQGLQLEANRVHYAYMSPGGMIYFTEKGQRRSLCEDTTTLVQEVGQTGSSLTHLEDKAKQLLSKSNAALTIGISVTIGFVVLLTVTIVFILLKRSGLHPCIKQSSVNKASDKPTGKASNKDSNDDNDGVHNYVVPEICVQRTNEPFDHSGHYDDACDTKEPEEDHNYVVNETQEPFEDGINTLANYNYTRVVKATQRVEKNPDNIYNKLRVDNHSDYDHLGTHRQDQSAGIETNDDYNTTAAVLTGAKSHQGDASAYNQVKYTRNKLHASGNDLRDYVITDYDVTYQAQFIFETEDRSGYAHVSKDC